jgi:outer membrane protein insertion porin family
MMLTKAVKITAAVLLWLICFNVIVFGEQADLENMPIGNIKVAGNSNVTAMKVLAVVICKSGNKFESRIAAEDCKRIAQLDGVEYAYFNTVAVDGRVELTFVVVEKNVVRSITFVGNKKYKQKALLKKIDFKKADFLDPVLVQASVTKLGDYYKKQGFPFAQVTLGEKSIETGNIVYNINEGARAKITDIKFEGNVGYSSKELMKVLKFKKKKFSIII